MTQHFNSMATLTSDLVSLGVQAGDRVMVHASLRAVGRSENGAATIIDAIKNVIGDTGTILMVLGRDDKFAWVNDHPAAERAGLLADAPAFDPEKDCADPDVGYLAEYFRQLPATKVNNHPDARFAACGPDAEMLLKDPPWNDYYGAGSPLEKFCALGGKILRLGADQDSTTVLHLAEYLTDIPDKNRVQRYHKIKTDFGDYVRMLDTLEDSLGIAEYGEEDYFTVILKKFIAAENGAQGYVGHAASAYLDAGKLVEFGTRWLKENYDPEAQE